MCECQLCGGPVLILGYLGNLLHTECRDCGMQFSCPADQDQDDETTDQPL
jgi:hypothetical protein